VVAPTRPDYRIDGQGLPDRFRRLYETADRSRCADGWSGREDEQDRAERLDRQRAGRIAAWERRLPVRFAHADLADVTDEQDPAGRARKWLARTESLTLLLTGEPDRGKTHIAYAVGRDALAAGVWVEAWQVADLNAALRPGGDEAAYDRIVAVDLLLLDDLGREQVTDWSLEQLQRILDARSRARLRQIVTTNLTYRQTCERYGTPIAGRLNDAATIVKVEGPSRRTPDPW
jgi:DNA replication protein DnaC